MTTNMTASVTPRKTGYFNQNYSKTIQRIGDSSGIFIQTNIYLISVF